MTEEMFDRAVETLRLREAAIEGARLVLLDGLSSAEAGRRCGRTGEWARMAAAKVTRAAAQQMDCPAGWEVVTVCLPLEQAVEVRSMAIQLREQQIRK